MEHLLIAGNDDVDLALLARAILNKKQFITRYTFIITALSLLTSLFIPNTYRSVGIFQSKMSGTAYKTTASAFADSQRFASYLAEKNLGDDPDLKYLQHLILDPESVQNAIVPLFDESIKDPKNQNEFPGNLNLLAVKISWSARSPQQARKTVSVLADFFRDSLLFYSLHDYIGSRFIESSESLRALKTLLLQNAFDQQQLESKKNDLQQIHKKYPAAAIEIKQIFAASPKAGGSLQYLSAGAEVMNTEVALSGLRRERVKVLRDLNVTELKYNFFLKANDLLKQNHSSGEILFRQFLDLKDQFFKGKDLSQDSVQELLTNLPSDLDTLSKAILSNVDINEMYFVSSPTLPTKKSGPHRVLIVIGTFLVVLFVLSISALMLDWWERNRISIEEYANASASTSARGSNGVLESNLHVSHKDTPLP